MKSKGVQLSSDRSLMFKQTFKVKEANRGIKITLNTSVGEPIECNQGVFNFLAKLSVIILDPGAPCASLVLTYTQAVIRM